MRWQSVQRLNLVLSPTRRESVQPEWNICRWYASSVKGSARRWSAHRVTLLVIVKMELEKIRLLRSRTHAFAVKYR